MTNSRPTSRFQFSIRKLLLWTVVVALYLGLCKWVEMDLQLFLLLTSWLVVVTIARLIWNVRAAVIATVALMSIAVTVVNFHGIGFLALLLLLHPLAVVFVVINVAIVEVAVFLVNWADDFMASKSDKVIDND